MRQLNGMFTQLSNRRHGRSGHLLQGRYKAILVDRESYLQELCRYVVLNPVRAGMVDAPALWAWSRLRHGWHIGQYFPILEAIFLQRKNNTCSLSGTV